MKFRFISGLLYYVIFLIGATLRCRFVGEERIEALRAASGKGVIIVGWHGMSFVPVFHYRNRGYWAMISTSRDGEYQDRIFRRFGFKTVRGSSSARGAVQATLRIVKELKAGGILTHTPDGPRGPRMKFQLGAIFMAIRSGCPIVPLGIYSSPHFVLPTWDRYLFPCPFAKSAIVYGEPVMIPEGADQEEQERWAQVLTDEIIRLTDEAAKITGAVVRSDSRNSNTEPGSLGQA